MKLRKLLEVIHSDFITVCDGEREFCAPIYFIKSHYKELLTRDVFGVCTDDGKIAVILKIL